MTRNVALVSAAVVACLWPAVGRPLAGAEICLDSTPDVVHRSLSQGAQQLAREIKAHLSPDTGVWFKVDSGAGAETRTAAEAVALALETNGRRAATAGSGDQKSGTWQVARIEQRKLGTRFQVEILAGEKRYTAFHLGKDWLEERTEEMERGYAWFRTCSEWGFDVGQADAEARRQLTCDLQRRIAPKQYTSTCPPQVDLNSLLTDSAIRRDEYLETKDRPYGIQYRRHLLVGVPQPLLAEWQSAFAKGFWMARTRDALATVLVWCALTGAVWAVYRLDRLTRGYRRFYLSVGFLGVLCVCIWLWHVVLS